MIVQRHSDRVIHGCAPLITSWLSLSVTSSLAVSSFPSVSPRVLGSRNWLAGGPAGELDSWWTPG